MMKNNKIDKLKEGDYTSPTQWGLKVKRTHAFIDKYIFPNSYKGCISYKLLLKEYDKCFKSTIIGYIQCLPYNIFLKSNYWKTISQMCKSNCGNKCVKCQRMDLTLNTHHTSYDNHGIEIENQDNLMVVCRKCHEEIHAQTKISFPEFW